MSVARKTPCLTQKSCRMGYLVLHRKRLEPRVLPLQQYSRCHFVSFVMDISGAKFKDHCSNISGDILDSVFNRFNWKDLWRHHFPHLHNTKTLISLKRKKIFQKGKRHSNLLWKAFQIRSNCFLLHRHFKKVIQFKMTENFCCKLIFHNFLFKQQNSEKDQGTIHEICKN